MGTYNTDEIDTSGQFHQLFTHEFFVRKHSFGAEISYESTSRSFVIFGAKISAKKGAKNVDEIDTRTQQRRLRV